ncbi:response regulator [bacterium]|nr:response regulator [bacterium]
MREILFAEDDPHWQVVVEEIARFLGYRIDHCRNAKEAEEKLFKKRRKYALVITDVRMPEESGLVLCEKLAKLRPELPVLILTGYRTKKLYRTVERLGIPYIFKPTTVSELLTAIESLTK